MPRTTGRNWNWAKSPGSSVGTGLAGDEAVSNTHDNDDGLLFSYIVGALSRVSHKGLYQGLGRLS